MPRTGRIRAGVVLALVAGLGSFATPVSADHHETAAEAQAPDAVSAAPEVYSLLHEDERVRVLDMHLPAGATDGLHRHPHEVVYFITGGAVSIALPSGETMEAEIPDGGVFSHGPWTHTVTNAGDTDIHGVVVELKSEPGARAAVPEGTDAVSVAPDNYQVLHSDERARVLMMTLPAGATDGEHTHPDEVAYFLSGGKATIDTADGSLEVEVPDGHVLSHESWTHTVTNAGDSEIRAVVWELN